MKVNTVVAKALAEKIIDQLKEIRKTAIAAIEKEILEEALADPLAKEFEATSTKLGEIYKKLQTKYKNKGFSSYSNSDKTVKSCFSFYNKDLVADVPKMEDIRNDIILNQAAAEDFNPTEFITKLVAEYKVKLKL